MNGAAITARQVQQLLANPRVADVEAEGLDEGRFFVHLNGHFDFGTDPCGVIRTKSFESYAEARDAISKAKLVSDISP